MSSDYKRVKLDETISDKVIGTHSGSFQADEACLFGVLQVESVGFGESSVDSLLHPRDLVYYPE